MLSFGDIWIGQIVAEQSTIGSGVSADFTILVDGVEKWRSEKELTTDTIKPLDFKVDLSDAKYEVKILIRCVSKGNGLAIGFVNWDTSYY